MRLPHPTRTSSFFASRLEFRSRECGIDLTAIAAAIMMVLAFFSQSDRCGSRERHVRGKPLSTKTSPRAFYLLLFVKADTSIIFAVSTIAPGLLCTGGIRHGTAGFKEAVSFAFLSEQSQAAQSQSWVRENSQRRCLQLRCNPGS